MVVVIIVNDFTCSTPPKVDGLGPTLQSRLIIYRGYATKEGHTKHDSVATVVWGTGFRPEILGRLVFPPSQVLLDSS